MPEGPRPAVEHATWCSLAVLLRQWLALEMSWSRVRFPKRLVNWVYGPYDGTPPGSTGKVEHQDQPLATEPAAAPGKLDEQQVTVKFNAYTPSEALMVAAQLAFRTGATLLNVAHGQYPGTYYADLSGDSELGQRVTEHRVEHTNLQVVPKTGSATPLWVAVRVTP